MFYYNKKTKSSIDTLIQAYSDIMESNGAKLVSNIQNEVAIEKSYILPFGGHVSALFIPDNQTKIVLELENIRKITADAYINYIDFNIASKDYMQLITSVHHKLDLLRYYNLN